MKECTFALCLVIGFWASMLSIKIGRLADEVQKVGSEIRQAKPQVPLLESPTVEEALSGKGEQK